MNNKSIKKNISFKGYLNKQLKDKAFKSHYNTEAKNLEVAYHILTMRKSVGLSQDTLAKKIGTTQSNIARIEAGKQNLTIELLHKISKALGRELKVQFA